MTDQTKRTHWLGPLKVSAGQSRGVERDGQIEETAADPTAQGANNTPGTSATQTRRMV
jgi:hypothetical protein